MRGRTGHAQNLYQAMKQLRALRLVLPLYSPEEKERHRRSEMMIIIIYSIPRAFLFCVAYCFRMSVTSENTRILSCQCPSHHGCELKILPEM